MDTPEDDRTKPRELFPSLCRQYRTAANLRQREVANGIGVKASSYGNMESVNHKSIAIDRVHKLARFFQLDELKTAELVAAWRALPASEYAQKQAKGYAERREARAKARNHDRLKTSLLEMATLLITSVEDPGTLCACVHGDPDLFAASESPTNTTQPLDCELCTALVLLGIGPWTNREDVVAKLAAAQEESA